MQIASYTSHLTATPGRLGFLAALLLVSIWVLLPLKVSPPSTHPTTTDIHNAQPSPDKVESAIPSPTVAVASPPTDRPLIVYAYAESAAARENFQFFLGQGLHGAADFVFIFNGNTNASDLVPVLPHIRIVKRENTCFDLGAIGEVLRTDDLWKKYKRFITMNASIRGPFLPTWASSTCWSDLFLNKVTEHNKLVGMTLNCQPRPHVQSMIFATDHVGMAILLDPGLATTSVDDEHGKKEDPVGLSGCYNDWHKAVHAEIGTTGLIIRAGYKVDVMMTSLHSEKGAEEYCKAHPESGDLLWNNRYFGGNIHPYETVFMKTNRDVEKPLMASLTAWHLKMNISSYDTCGRG
ncbi:hypothetical protein B0H63DRAFT_96999 [Podospora didyma]|uniref:Uncharacterized protein n=1 Tax=Podospora didyma TaxID=330526 RepID=A0AAE0NX18_9PEZI|nr:hypothetical protein B0H63DRAFT_96999 [Podospora didyma]